VIRHDPEAVTADGSPVAVYRALPAEPGFGPLLEVLRPPASVLDLGCGAGRLANLLAARGFAVMGVDASPAMLAGLAPPVRLSVHGSSRSDSASGSTTWSWPASW
jgi:SAM-dependent methyltransferase